MSEIHSISKNSLFNNRIIPESFLSPEQLHAMSRFESQVLDDWERKKVGSNCNWKEKIINDFKELAKKHTNEEHVLQSSLR